MCLCVFVTRWTLVTEMSASRSAAGVTIFEGRIYVSGGHDGLQIFNTVSKHQHSIYRIQLAQGFLVHFL